MTSRADRQTRKLLRRDAMRFRNRWSAYARQSAVSDTLSRMALAAEQGTNPLDLLTMTGQMPIKRFLSLPSPQIVFVAAMLILCTILVLIESPLRILSIAPLLGIFGVIRYNWSISRGPTTVTLAESELAHLLSEKMRGGLTVSQAMMELPGIFTPSQVAVVRSGEESGNLADALRQLSLVTEVRQSGGVFTFQRQYPFIALILFTAIGSFIMTMTIPKFVDIFSQLGAELPIMTQVLIRIMSFHVPGLGMGLLSFLVLLLLCLCIDHLVRLHAGRVVSGVVCGLVALQVPGVLGLGYASRHNPLFDGEVIVFGMAIIIGFLMPRLCDLVRGMWALTIGTAVAWIPWLRHRFAGLDRANFLHSLGLMLERGIPAAEAINHAAPTLIPAGLKRAAERAAKAVERGEPIDVVLRKFHLVRRREWMRLQLAIRAGTFPAECRRQSLDLAERERLRIAKRERMVRPIIVGLIGAYAAAFLLMMYTPLLYIPRLVGQ